MVIRSTIEDHEQYLIESIAADVNTEDFDRFGDAVDDLVGFLLSGIGYYGRPTDGVIFEYTEQKGNCVFGSGVAIMIEGQLVEPLRVEFTFNCSKTKLENGLVYFGDASTPAVRFGSREHWKLLKQIILDPRIEYPWKECFRRDATGWINVT